MVTPIHSVQTPATGVKIKVKQSRKKSSGQATYQDKKNSTIRGVARVWLRKVLMV